MHKKKETIKSGDKVQEGVIVKVQGEQGFTEETGDIKIRKDPRRLESGEDFWRHKQMTVCWWKAKGADLGEKEHERILLDKFAKEFRN